MRNYVRIPQEKYEALREIPGLAARMLDEEVLYGTNASNWLADYLSGSPAAVNRYKMAGQLYRASAFNVASYVANNSSWQTWLWISNFEPVEGELAAIVAARTLPRGHEIQAAVADIRRSTAWTVGFRPPWAAVISVARIATLLTWPAPAPAAKPAAEPVAAPTAAPATERTAAPAAPAAEPTAPAEPAPAPAAPAAKPARPRRRR